MGYGYHLWVVCVIGIGSHFDFLVSVDGVGDFLVVWVDWFSACFC